MAWWIILQIALGAGSRLHHNFLAIATFSPSTLGVEACSMATTRDLIISWRKALIDDALPLSQRYRALFGLKHHACVQPPTENTVPAVEAIAAGFSTSSALLKHEVAYCLGQTGNLATAPYLRDVLQNFKEDPMVRHESAEALGALGDTGSLDLLKARRDDPKEEVVVKETCEIADARIEWEASEESKAESLKQR